LNDVNDTGSGDAVTVEQAYSATASNAGNITSLQGQYTVKIDNNGAVSGFGLASTNVNGTIVSEFIVNADRFAIMDPGTTLTNGAGNHNANVPFIVQSSATTINGVSVPAGVYMTDAFIRNGSIVNAKIGDAAIDNAKISSLSADKLTAGKVSTSLLNIDGATLTSTVNDQGVSVLQIADLAVTNAKIANATIEEGKIKNLAVSTLKIQDQAVTIPVSNITVADQSLTQGGGFQTVQTITHVATGAPVEIAVGFRARSQTGSSGRLAFFAIFRGSTQVFNSGNFYIPGTNGAIQSFLFSETPPAGTYTYTLQVAPGALGSSNLLVSNAYLRTLETKK
jgi:hypothetical protein